VSEVLGTRTFVTPTSRFTDFIHSAKIVHQPKFLYAKCAAARVQEYWPICSPDLLYRPSTHVSEKVLLTAKQRFTLSLYVIAKIHKANVRKQNGCTWIKYWTLLRSKALALTAWMWVPYLQAQLAEKAYR